MAAMDEIVRTQTLARLVANCGPVTNEFLLKRYAALERELIAAEQERDKCKAAVAAVVDWMDSEDKGPEYRPGTFRANPGGEDIWRAWWGSNLQKCNEATRLCREAMKKKTD